MKPEEYYKEERYKDAVRFFIVLLITMIISVIILCFADKKAETHTVSPWIIWSISGKK